MNIKSLLGAILGILGVVGLLYTVMLFSSNAGDTTNVQMPIIFGAVAIVLLFSGIGLVETVKED